MTMYEYEREIVGESLPQMDTGTSVLELGQDGISYNPLLSANNNRPGFPSHRTMAECRLTERGNPVTAVSSADLMPTSREPEPRISDLCERVNSMEMAEHEMADVSAHGPRLAENDACKLCRGNRKGLCKCNRGLQIDTFLMGQDNGGTRDDTKKRCLDVMRVYSGDKDGDTILHIAIIIRSVDIAMLIINMTPSYGFFNLTNLLFQTVLHLAVLTNQIQLVRRFIVGGAEVESRDKDGNTSLHIACRDNRMECMKMLLEPVTYAETKQNMYEIPYQRIPQDLEIKNYAGVTCLHIAASKQYFDIVDVLIAKGANVNAKECKRGYTILHEACWSGNLRLVKYLLRCKGCNINARTFDDYTPFDLAKSRNNWDVCMELASAGAKYREDDEDDY